jgi:DNA ligase-1
MPIRPMLGIDLNEIDPVTLKFPFYSSAKIDGVRMILEPGKCYSRNGKPFRNAEFNSHVLALQKTLPIGLRDKTLDCEVTIGYFASSDVLRKTTSALNSIQSNYINRDIYIFIHDICLPETEAEKRLEFLESFMGKVYVPFYILKQTKEVSLDNILESYGSRISNGFEGLMLRQSNSLYKHGRSTKTDQCLLKLKPHKTGTAVIIGFIEEEENLNHPETDPLGYQKRSSHQSYKFGKGSLGSLVVNSEEFGTFKIGTGFSATQRKLIWENRHNLEGTFVSFSYFSYGIKDKPRHPVFDMFLHNSNKQS